MDRPAWRSVALCQKYVMHVQQIKRTTLNVLRVHAIDVHDERGGQLGQEALLSGQQRLTPARRQFLHKTGIKIHFLAWKQPLQMKEWLSCLVKFLSIAAGVFLFATIPSKMATIMREMVCGRVLISFTFSLQTHTKSPQRIWDAMFSTSFSDSDVMTEATPTAPSTTTSLILER